MKPTLLEFAAVAAFAVKPARLFAAGGHALRGYVTNDGNYVALSRATNPDYAQRDNCGPKPNADPCTDKHGACAPAEQ